MKSKVQVEVTRDDLLKMAAFLDGEGCIHIECQSVVSIPGAASPRFQLVISVPNTDPRLALWCAERFGGNYYPRFMKSDKHRTCWVWMATALVAEKVLRACLPYFLLKREQADIALAFREAVCRRTGKKLRLTGAELAERQSYKERLSAMKREEITNIN